MNKIPTIVMICNYDDDDNGKNSHQEYKDEHGYDLGPHETGLVVQPAVVVVTILGSSTKNQGIEEGI